MRELLGEIDEAMQSDRWKRPGAGLDATRQLVQSLQAFDDVTHRPKGELLRSTLRGRSPEADALLDRLNTTRDRCDGLLAQALASLDALARGDPGTTVECSPLLAQHRQLMLEHLDEEDTLLHSQTAALLTPEEWSQIVSSISSAVHAPGTPPWR